MRTASAERSTESRADVKRWEIPGAYSSPKSLVVIFN